MVVRRIVMLAFTRIGKGFFVLMLLWMAWEYFGPQRPVVSGERAELVDNVAPVVVDDLQAANLPTRSVALLYFENDPSGYVTDRLREELLAKWPLDLRDLSFFQKLRNFLGLRPKGFGDTASALEGADHLRVEGVIYGTVKTHEATDDGAVFEMELSVAEIATGRLIFGPQVYGDSTGGGVLGGAASKKNLRRVGFAKRLFFLALLVLLLPIFSIAFLRSAAAKRQNRTNALVLGIYTGADALLAILLLGTNFKSTLSVLLLLIVVVAALLYNVAVMTHAVHLEE